jgi:hypothetical protein
MSTGMEAEFPNLMLPLPQVSDPLHEAPEALQASQWHFGLLVLGFAFPGNHLWMHLTI